MSICKCSFVRFHMKKHIRIHSMVHVLSDLTLDFLTYALIELFQLPIEIFCALLLNVNDEKYHNADAIPLTLAYTC